MSSDSVNQPETRVFVLNAYNKPRDPIYYVVVTPEDVQSNVVAAAWAYALRYTAQGLDLPDHVSAIELLKERHPSWMVISSKVSNIPVNLALADQDTPETE
jgi:hypothetical protein